MITPQKGCDKIQLRWERGRSAVEEGRWYPSHSCWWGRFSLCSSNGQFFLSVSELRRTREVGTAHPAVADRGVRSSLPSLGW